MSATRDGAALAHQRQTASVSLTGRRTNWDTAFQPQILQERLCSLFSFLSDGTLISNILGKKAVQPLMQSRP